MDKLEKIERYLQGKLSAEETKAFEQDVTNDPALAQAVERLRFELELIGQLEADALRATLQKLRQQETGSTTKSAAFDGFNLKRYRWWAAAAAMAVLITALFLWPQTNKHDNLVAEDYRLYPDDYAGNLKASEEASRFDPHPIEILEKQDKSHALEALRYFQSFVSKDSLLQMRARMNLAHAQLLADNVEDAIQTFEGLESTAPQGNSIRQAAQYYRALAMLRKKDFHQAQRLLHTIADQPAHPYSGRAKRILGLITPNAPKN